MSDMTASDTPVLDLLATMTAESVQVSSLDVQSIALVRLAALVASDAPAVSYALNLAIAYEVGLDAEAVRGVLAAIAPIVGTSRVAAATSRIVLAIGVGIEQASAQMADDEPN
jgi:4-carboxymuconolactone decarboxylase